LSLLNISSAAVQGVRRNRHFVDFTFPRMMTMSPDASARLILDD